MSNTIDTAIIGLGLTGYSCLQFFCKRQIPVVVTDSRDNPPYLAQVTQNYPHVPVYCGGFAKDAVLSARQVMISQGISHSNPVIQEILQSDKPIVSDIEIFANFNTRPVLAITGSNGKSTVTSLLAEMSRKCDCNARVGGNLGPP